VSELTRYLKYLLEHDELLTQLSVRGEISDFSRPVSGHLYFTLKDMSSQIPCVLFRREALQQPEVVRSLRPGLAVVVHGFLTVYEPRGSCQIYAERVVPEGEGAQFRRFEELKIQLEAEGLFAQERKRPLPTFPRRIALITSPEGQAYYDVLHRLQSQYPFVTVIVAGVSVQGEAAADEMTMAIDIVNRLTDADLILLVRGGGAPEELAAFNQERLARAVYASRVPVVTGVGHETDYTIVDFVADRRAATPSLAAAVAVPDLTSLLQQIRHLHGQLTQTVHQRLRDQRTRWVQVNRTLLAANPQSRLQHQHRRAGQLSLAMQRQMTTQLRAKRAHLYALRGRLEALDPLAILQRGYAVLTDAETGEVVSRVEGAAGGRKLRARVSDGEFGVRVESS
jgi:exodeoxyribonuclease VII large subunit